jgi:hypothetical protein
VFFCPGFSHGNFSINVDFNRILKGEWGRVLRNKGLRQLRILDDFNRILKVRGWVNGFLRWNRNTVDFRGILKGYH